MTQKIAVLGLTLSEIEAEILKIGLPKFVSKQVYEWIYKKKVFTFSGMKNISKKNQELLSDVFDIKTSKRFETLESADKDAIKCSLELHDKKLIEMVILKEKDYYTLCVSSQVGCPVDCKFCMTGIMGFKRNLNTSEIIEQVLLSYELGKPITNIVFMGMGEPLLNYEALFKALDILCDEKGLNMSKRKITVSTSGHIKMIQRLIDEERIVNLAFSVGSTDPLIRYQLMPIEKNNPILEVSKVLKEFLAGHNRKLTLEYTLLAGKNVSDLQMKGLANLAKYLDAKVNLINLNPNPAIPFQPLSSNALLHFRDSLKKEGVSVTIRYRKGQDIQAACGQLAGSSMIKAS